MSLTWANPAASLQLQCLIEQLREVIDDGRFTDRQGGPGLLRRRLPFRRRVAGKSDDGDVSGGGIRLQRGNHAANLLATSQIRDYQQRTGAARRLKQRRQVIDRLDTIIQILQPVHQLAAGHELFVKNERERLRHAVNVRDGGINSKVVLTRPR